MQYVTFFCFIVLFAITAEAQEKKLSVEGMSGITTGTSGTSNLFDVNLQVQSNGGEDTAGVGALEVGQNSHDITVDLKGGINVGSIRAGKKDAGLSLYGVSGLYWDKASADPSDPSLFLGFETKAYSPTLDRAALWSLYLSAKAGALVPLNDEDGERVQKIFATAKTGVRRKVGSMVFFDAYGQVSIDGNGKRVVNGVSTGDGFEKDFSVGVSVGVETK